MKTLCSIICAVLVLFASSAALATPIITVNGVPSDGPLAPADVSTGGLDLYTFAIDNSTSQDAYDTINVSIVPDGGFLFNNLENVGGVLNFQAGNDDTDFLGINTVAIGLTLVGVVDENTELSGVITTFGGFPTDQLNNPFAQVVVQPGAMGSIRVDFALAGQNVLEPVLGRFGIPEPGTIALAGIGLVGMIARRRR